ncbi:MAG: hypothetical protein R2712_11755 [Vicinamibacterales bacterium]
MPSPVPGPKSLGRTLVAVTSLVASLVVIAAGFVWMVTALRSGGYGTSRLMPAMIALGLGGGLMALGIALLIWEMSVRYGIRK